MINNTMDGGGIGGWFMGGFGIQLVVVLVFPLLVTAALIKHLFFTGRGNN